MPLHVDKNGVGSVTPNYLYGTNGVVAHPLQKNGQLAHLPNAHGGSAGVPQGHPWFGSNKTAVQTPGQT